MEAICTDLIAEHDALDALVTDLVSEAWDTPTPAPRWSVRDQISHLWFFDRTATLAATDAAAFEAHKVELLGAVAAPGVEPDTAAGRAITPAELLVNWRRDREVLVSALRPLDPKSRLPWYGPAMAAPSFATARLMETWAHGQDVADAIGVQREPTARLRHVAHIGVRARPFAYLVNEMSMPASEIHVALLAPDASVWTWGDEASPHRVEGHALEFCLVATQRRHLDDTSLRITDGDALEWMRIAQTFAGGPGAGREPGQFSED